jgi:hypothetical protein
MAEAANISRLESMVVLLSIDGPKSSKIVLVGGLLPRPRANNSVLTINIVSPSIFFF